VFQPYYNKKKKTEYQNSPPQSLNTKPHTNKKKAHKLLQHENKATSQNTQIIRRISQYQRNRKEKLQ